MKLINYIFPILLLAMGVGVAACGGGGGGDGAQSNLLAQPARAPAVRPVAHLQVEMLPPADSSPLRRPRVSLRFDEPIKRESITGIVLRPVSGAPVEISDISWGGDDRLSFVPLVELTEDAIYEVKLPSCIESITRKNLPGDISLKFHTAKKFTPRGLDNVGNSCFINAALQIIINSKRLRDEVWSANLRDPHKEIFTNFFDAYDSGASKDLQVSLHRVVTHLRDSGGVSKDVGTPDEVLDAINVDYQGIAENIQIINDLYPSQKEFFILHVNGLPAIDYSLIPSVGYLNGFSYNPGNHYIAYIRRGSNWYKVDDRHVSAVSESDLNDLRATESTGIAFISYE